ncbi:CPBP family intramembrane glutamic endopeptidase [Massilia glaciei]|uniref:CPBP family intramembrane metalloprotease n=1 Tax=Massilia glaciei TaxID=1524097 RepID=A0A2U2HK67_9BURK|nr:type II CAAX endopeptidase family protein [Massilia glaciei]PWF47873.1 CPBP family intramembrane metalloprotease [Massilia glaciei]
MTPETANQLRLRPAWSGLLPAAPFVGAALALVFLLMRGAGVLGPARWQWALPLGFVLMAAVPWILLSRQGRREIGLKAPTGRFAFSGALACGAASALLCFALGMLLYGRGADNWYVSIADSYRRAIPAGGMSPLMLQIALTLPACIFSPVGEEIFFRGFLQRAFAQRWGARAGGWIESSVFGLVHLVHHGLVANAAGLRPGIVSAALWVVLMVLTARMFGEIRRRADSVLPAIAAHAAFNFTMSMAIFQALW